MTYDFTPPKEEPNKSPVRDISEAQAVWLFMHATNCRFAHSRHYIVSNLERTKESKYKMADVGKLIRAYYHKVAEPTNSAVNPGFCCALCGAGFDFGCNCPDW